MMTKRIPTALLRWIDSGSTDDTREPANHRAVDWLRVVPFAVLHPGCLGVLWVGCSPFAVAVAAMLFALRMFAVTAFYHRYFSHRAFRASRPVQFVFALLAASAVQRGPL